MTGFFAQTLPIWRAASARTKSRYSWLGPVSMVVWIAIALWGLSRTWLSAWQVLTIGIGFPVAALMAGTLLSLAASCALQNTPANAALVPQLNRHVRRTVALFWVATLLAWAAVGASVPFGPLLVLGAHTALALLLAAPASSWATVNLVLFIAVLSAWGRPIRDALQDPILFAAAAFASILLAWYSLRRRFPQGGDAHFARLKQDLGACRKANMEEYMADSRRRVSLYFSYGRLLGWDIARGAVAPLLMHTQGPGLHPVGFVFNCVLGVLGLIATRLVLLALWPHAWSALTASAHIFAFSLAIAYVFGASFQLKASLGRSSKEQALFLLAPKAPLPGAVNRVLARRIVLVGMLEWLNMLGTMMAIDLVFEVAPHIMLLHFTLMCGLLMLVGWPLDDLARDRNLSYAMPLAAGTFMLALGALLYAAGAANWLWLPYWIFSTILIGRRWRAMLAAPPAFPTRRLAA